MSSSIDPDYEVVIGLEVHVQLNTETKLFCGCPSKSRDGVSVGELSPNAHVCPVCAGHPGTLPVMNEKALEYAIRAGLATNCEISNRSIFARKNYFYPDLPKGYQISQYEAPLCENGYVEVEVEGSDSKKISIERIHIEEDAGKSVHGAGYSMVNLNRAAVPLIEIVSRPEMRSAAEASAYLRNLYAIVTYAGVCAGNLQEGNFRVDVNVSVKRKSDPNLGTRTETKNMNSFKFVEKAIEFEAARQIELVKSGERVIQETRGYDSARNVTTSQRTKEEAHDYRYFPDPDLISLQVPDEWITQIRESLPELPADKKKRYIEQFGLGSYDSQVLINSYHTANFFESVMKTLEDRGLEPSDFAKSAVNLINGEVIRLINEAEKEVYDSALTDTHIADTVVQLRENSISSTNAKQLVQIAWNEGGDIEKLIEEKGMKQVNDLSELIPLIDEVISRSAKQVEEFKAGKEKILGYFVGQVMKSSGGKANPKMLQDEIRKRLKGE